MEVDSWITITILVNFIALIFQIGAYAAPMWLWWQNSNGYFGIGLWYSVCSQGTVGVSCSTTDSYDGAAPFLAVRVLQSVGLAGILTLAIFLIVYKIGHSGKWDSMNTVNLVTFILCILTILILLASAVVFPAYYWPAFTYLGTHDRTSLPWSPIMSFIACLILMIVCYFIRNKCRRDRLARALPMSGDAKLDFHPHVQNGQTNRYYNQTPYMEDRDRYVDERSHGHIRGYSEYDDRRNGNVNGYEQRTTYVNRAYQVEPESAVHYKSASREFRENRDRELGHTIYTGAGFSYLKGEVSRPEREDRFSRDHDDRYNRQEERFGRPVALVEYNSPRGHDDYYDHLRSSVRPLPGSSRGNPASNVYVYRPHHY